MRPNAFDCANPLPLARQIAQKHRAVREGARAYCRGRLTPGVLEAFRHGRTDLASHREVSELGMLGPAIPDCSGGIGLDHVSYGLSAREVQRVGSGSAR